MSVCFIWAFIWLKGMNSWVSSVIISYLVNRDFYPWEKMCIFSGILIFSFAIFSWSSKWNQTRSAILFTFKYFCNSVVTSLYSSFYCFFVSPIPGNLMYLPPTLVLTVIIHQKIHLQSRTWSFLAFFDRFVQNTAGNSGTRRTTRNELLVDELQAMHTTFATRKTIPYTAPGHDGNIAVFY